LLRLKKGNTEEKRKKKKEKRKKKSLSGPAQQVKCHGRDRFSLPQRAKVRISARKDLEIISKQKAYWFWAGR
jgi:hypothetical protein